MIFNIVDYEHQRYFISRIRRIDRGFASIRQLQFPIQGRPPGIYAGGSSGSSITIETIRKCPGIQVIWLKYSGSEGWQETDKLRQRVDDLDYCYKMKEILCCKTIHTINIVFEAGTTRLGIEERLSRNSVCYSLFDWLRAEIAKKNLGIEVVLRHKTTNKTILRTLNKE